MKNSKRFFLHCGIVCVIGILCFALIFGFAYALLVTVCQQNNQELLCRDFRTEIACAQLKHQTWLNAIETAMAVRKPKIVVTPNSQECDFGKWYYRKGNEVIEQMPSSIHEEYHQIGDIHLDVHRLGNELIAMWNVAAPQPAIDFMQNSLLPKTQQMMGSLEMMNTHVFDEAERLRYAKRDSLNRIGILVAIVLILGTCIIVIYSLRSIP